jgi:2-keto-3-deoxy-L-rhamnonate aldolase RhmA
MAVICRHTTAAAAAAAATTTTANTTTITITVTNITTAHAVAQLVEAMRYKPEGRGFDARWCHWNFSLT